MTITKAIQGSVTSFNTPNDILSLVLQNSLVAQRVKHLPSMKETWVQSLGGEDPLENEMATHSSILPGKFHGQRSLAGYSLWGCKELDTTKQSTASSSTI